MKPITENLRLSLATSASALAMLVATPALAQTVAADVDEGRIEIGHYALQTAEEDALDPRWPVAADHLQLDQATFRHQRHQERRGQHMADEAIDAAHGAEASRSATVSNSGNPTIPE